MSDCSCCPHAMGVQHVKGHPCEQCDDCANFDAEPFVQKAIAEVEARSRKLLDTLGKRDRCQSCKAEIWWCTTKNGKPMPVSVAGLMSHFGDCVSASEHRKPRATPQPIAGNPRGTEEDAAEAEEGAKW